MAKTDWLPPGNHVLTPYLTVNDAKAAIDFYIQAFGTKEVMRMPGPDGQKVMHAELQLGNSRVMLSDAFPEMGGSEAPSAHSGSPVTVHMYVADTDATVARAEAFGAKVTMPPADMFWATASPSSGTRSATTGASPRTSATCRRRRWRTRCGS